MRAQSCNLLEQVPSVAVLKVYAAGMVLIAHSIICYQLSHVLLACLLTAKCNLLHPCVKTLTALAAAVLSRLHQCMAPALFRQSPGHKACHLRHPASLPCSIDLCACSAAVTEQCPAVVQAEQQLQRDRVVSWPYTTPCSA